MRAFAGCSADIAGTLIAFNRGHGVVPFGRKIMPIVIHRGIPGEIYFDWSSGASNSGSVKSEKEGNCQEANV